MFCFSFERLDVYHKSRGLVIAVYEIIDNLPQTEKYCICSQLRRAIVSVPSNIAEGCGRNSYKEKIHFFEIAYGSLFESYCQLEICRDLGFISEEVLNSMKDQFYSVARMLNAIVKSYREQAYLGKQANS